MFAFYRKDMARYGQVIFCRGNRPVGTPTVTQDGLTCDKEGKTNIHVNDDEEGAEGELKTGSKLHQRIVSVDPQGSGTKFGLVVLDLPGHLGIEDKDTRRVGRRSGRAAELATMDGCPEPAIAARLPCPILRVEQERAVTRSRRSIAGSVALHRS